METAKQRIPPAMGGIGMEYGMEWHRKHSRGKMFVQFFRLEPSKKKNETEESFGAGGADLQQSNRNLINP